MKKLYRSTTLFLILSLITFSGVGQQKEKSSTEDAIPFAVVDQAPAFPGCENLKGDQLKDCTVQKITNHVNTNFNTSVGKDLNIQGQTRIVVQFKIDDQGKVTNVRSRSLANEANVREIFQEEADRVVSGLPQMHPGKMKGKEVGIMYSLPIVFAMPEKEMKKDN